jgi:cyanophycinase
MNHPRLSAFLSLNLLLATALVASRAESPAVTQPAGEIPGALVIASGGPLPLAVRDRFLELAGGKSAKLVVISTASAGPEGPEAAKDLDIWKKRGVTSVVLLNARRREEANAPEFVRPLTEATGVWLGGGDPDRLVEVLRGTAVEKALHQVLARGGVVGGTAAGAAVMSGLMITGTSARAEIGDGLGLLPGTVIDQHFLKRNRLDRLLGVLTKYPGHVGFGIDEQTALVVQGRGLSVVGSSYVLACLAPAGKRPASVRVLKAGDRADLMALTRAAAVRSGPPFPPEKPRPPHIPAGTLMIGGGGGFPADLWKRFIRLAGGPDSLIVVVPTALEDPVPAEPVEARMLKRAGAKNIKIFHTRKRTEADSAAFVAPLREAKGVWFGGGRQWRFVDAYEGTATEKAFHDVLRRGGVIGGSSAGASIQSEYMPRGDPLGNLNIIAEGYERGFGFLPGVAIDQHFFARRRQRDMSELMAVYPQLLGIGVDEGTVIVVQGSVLEVVGRGKVAIYDRRKPVTAGAKDYEELTAGTRYNLETGLRIGK